MALPSSGSLSFVSLVNEFGGSGSVGLSEYYRGGAFVPNISVNNNIPTSGTISLSNFYNSTGKLIGSFNIYSDFQPFNLRNRLVADFGWDQIRPVEIYINQYAGRFTATSSNDFAMTIGDMPDGSLVTLNVYGRIEGFSGRPTWIAGGNMYGGPALFVGFGNTVINVYAGGSIIGGGGAGGNPGDHLRAATAGGGGGNAISITLAVPDTGIYPRIYNYGLIAGGGGGGGGGAAAGVVSSCAPIGQPGGEAGFIVQASGGGGGGGQTTYGGFVAGGYFSFDYTFCVTDGGVLGYGNLGGNSSFGGAPGAGGAGMRVGGAGGAFAYGGNGGDGGTWGNAGGAGGAGGPAGGGGGYAKITYRGQSTTVVQGDTRGSWA
jgi:hypothetical protein